MRVTNGSVGIKSQIHLILLPLETKVTHIDISLFKSTGQGPFKFRFGNAIQLGNNMTRIIGHLAIPLETGNFSSQ